MAIQFGSTWCSAPEISRFPTDFTAINNDFHIAGLDKDHGVQYERKTIFIDTSAAIFQTKRQQRKPRTHLWSCNNRFRYLISVESTAPCLSEVSGHWTPAPSGRIFAIGFYEMIKRTCLLVDDAAKASALLHAASSRAARNTVFEKAIVSFDRQYSVKKRLKRK
jgi:hypothetical protein